MQTVTEDHLYSWVRKSELYRSFDENTIYNEEVQVPKKFLPQSLRISNLIELKKVMHVLRYWLVDGLPEEVCEYISNVKNKEELNEIKQMMDDYFKDFFYDQITLLLMRLNNLENKNSLFIPENYSFTVDGRPVNESLRKFLNKYDIIKSDNQSFISMLKWYKVSPLVLDLIRESNKKHETYISGSSILAYLTRSYFERDRKKKWYPKDIDIFTNDPSVINSIKSLSDNYQTIFETDQESLVPFAQEKSYFFAPSMKKIVNYTFGQNSFGAGSKVQVILVDGSVKHYIDQFDLDFIKSYYDGTTFHIKNLKSILTKTSTIGNTYQNRCSLEREVRRIRKYSKRRYKIKVPKIIKIEETMSKDNFKNYLGKMRHIGETISYWFKKIDDHTLARIKDIKHDSHRQYDSSDDDGDESDSSGDSDYQLYRGQNMPRNRFYD